MRHVVVISDIHLAETEPTDGPWMRYRQRRFSPDGELATMLDALRGRAGGDELTLVLNGDIFDFDAPRVVGEESICHDLPRNAEHAVPSMRAILDDHPDFVAALGRMLAAGHRLVFISGNHDVQLTLEEVRDELRERLAEAAHFALGEGRIEDEARHSARDRITFRAWFLRTDTGIVVEHGHQYDPHCALRHPMLPFVERAREIEPTMGSLAARLVVAKMGYINPHVDASFTLSPLECVRHWLKYYALSRRSLILAWVVGALRTLWTLKVARKTEARDRRHANAVAASMESAVPLRTAEKHARLFARPTGERLRAVLRELWIDRFGFAVFCLALCVICLCMARGPFALLALLGPLAFIAYERLAPRLPLGTTWREVDRAARRVGRIHRARAVIFGHTHAATGCWNRGIFYGNTGSWSASYRDAECSEPNTDERPLVWLTVDAECLSGGLYAWTQGRFEERSTAVARAPRDEARGERTRARRRRYWIGTVRDSTRPGSEAPNASTKNGAKPTAPAM